MGFGTEEESSTAQGDPNDVPTGVQCRIEQGGKVVALVMHIGSSA